MKQYWKQPTGINGLLYGQPATVIETRTPRVKLQVVAREERLRAESVRAHNNAIQFERDRKQAAKAARRAEKRGL